MFEKFTRSAAKGAVENVKRTLKEEITKSADDIIPTIFGLAAIAILVVANVPPQKIAKTVPASIVINNFYI